MKVFQVHTRYRQPGGEDSVVEAEAAVLRAAGHDVTQYQVANPESAGATAAALAAAPWNPAAARRVAAAATAAGAEIAHVHNTWFALSPAIVPALRRAGLPVVITLHNYRLLCANSMLFRDGRPCQDCVGSHPWHGVVHRCYRGSVSASTVSALTVAANRRTWRDDATLFLALTEFGRQRFIEGGLPPAKVQVKSNFVPDVGPRLTPPSRSDRVLFVGRLSPEKGLHVVLDAWRQLDLPLRLQVIGDGPARRDLLRRAPDGVEFLGRLSHDEVQQAMREARALVFPSLWYEGQGMTLLESFAAGLPAVVSKLGGSADLLRGGGGWTATPGDVSSWVRNLSALANDDTVDATGAKARRRYEAGFSPEQGLAGLEAAYRWALAAG